MNSINKKSRFMLAASLAAVSLLAAGCLDDGQDVAPVEVAYVSLYHASPDAPDLGIIVDQRQINSNPFDYSEYTGYMRFFTGSRNFRISPFGANNVVVDTTLSFENDKAYSIFVVDNYQQADVLVLQDSANAVDGKAMVRFLNLSPDAAAVNLHAKGETSPLFTGQSFKAQSGFKAVDPKDYDFTVTSGDGTVTLLELPDSHFVAGRFYTIVVTGYSTPPAGNNNALSAEIIRE